MRLKYGAFVVDPGKIRQTENLKPAAIGENQSRPAHELMKAAKFGDNVGTRPQSQVVRVAQDDLCTRRFQLFDGHALYRAQGTNRHERGCFGGTARR